MTLAKTNFIQSDRKYKSTNVTVTGLVTTMANALLGISLDDTLSRCKIISVSVSAHILTSTTKMVTSVACSAAVGFVTPVNYNVNAGSSSTSLFLPVNNNKDNEEIFVRSSPTFPPLISIDVSALVSSALVVGDVVTFIATVEYVPS